MNAFALKEVLSEVLYEFKSDMLINDLIKEEMSTWKYIMEQKEYYKIKGEELPKKVSEHIFNFYDYLAYLILNFKINRNDAKELWEHNIIGIYKDFNEEFVGHRDNVKILVKQWKD